MKNFITKLSNFWPLLLVIILINVTVDPAQIFHSGYEAKAASIIVSGQNVAGMSDYNERIFQEQVILQEKTCPDTIIIGSSRVMELSGDVIGGMNSFRNLGMSGAGIYDYLGIMGIYQNIGSKPRRVIIGLDPWVLNDNNGDNRYQALQKYINKFEENLKNNERLLTIELPYVQNKLQVFSLSYLQSSLVALKNDPSKFFFNNSESFYATTEKDVPEGIRYSDGSTEYDFDYRNRSTEDVNNDAKAYIAGDVYQLEGFHKISLKYCELLEELLNFFEQENIEVVFFLPPYHPYVYEALSTSDKYKIINAVEEYFRELAAKRNIAVYGSYDPKSLSCIDSDFLDGMHLRRREIYKAWKQVSSENLD